MWDVISKPAKLNPGSAPTTGRLSITAGTRIAQHFHLQKSSRKKVKPLYSIAKGWFLFSSKDCCLHGLLHSPTKRRMRKNIVVFVRYWTCPTFDWWRKKNPTYSAPFLGFKGNISWLQILEACFLSVEEVILIDERNSQRFNLSTLSQPQKSIILNTKS